MAGERILRKEADSWAAALEVLEQVREAITSGGGATRAADLLSKLRLRPPARQ